MRNQILTGMVVVAGASAQAQPHHHGDDGVVGVNGNGVLGMEIDLDEAYPFEEFFTSALLNGWISDAPGFTALDENEPDEDFFVLGAGADVHFELVGTSSGAMEVYNPFFDIPALSGGDRFAFGAGDFDTHPFWFLNTDHPSYDPSDAEWSVDFKLVDLGSTGYADSETFTIRFVIPSPAGAGLFAVGGIFAAWRRR